VRIQTHSLADFFANIEAHPVVGGKVWVSMTENPVDGDRRKAAKFRVAFQVTAVCEFDDGQFLLDLGIDCGLDYRDCSKDNSASEEAARLRRELVAGCGVRDITVMPGMIDMG